jgi:hypothetical protein
MRGWMAGSGVSHGEGEGRGVGARLGGEGACEARHGVARQVLPLRESVPRERHADQVAPARAPGEGVRLPRMPP